MVPVAWNICLVALEVSGVGSVRVGGGSSFFLLQKKTASPLLVEVVLKDMIQGNFGHNAANRQAINNKGENKVCCRNNNVANQTETKQDKH